MELKAALEDAAGRVTDEEEKQYAEGAEGCVGGCRSRAGGGRECELWR